MTNFFKKAAAERKQISSLKVLSTAELVQVSGGLNPQPLPPSPPDPHARRMS